MYRQSEKNLLSSSNSSTCPHNMVNFGPLAAEICWRVWGTPANFNGFHVLVTLLQRRRSAEASQTLHDVWPCSALLHYIYIPGGSCLHLHPSSHHYDISRTPRIIFFLSQDEIAEGLGMFYVPVRHYKTLNQKCGPMPNVMVALSNIGGPWRPLFNAANFG